MVKVWVRVGDWSGYAANSAEMWASERDGLYTINGRMPPSDGELVAHQFQITTHCLSENPGRIPQPGIADYGP